MKTIFTEIKDDLEVIDLAIEKGWSPHINKLPDGNWHVGMKHSCCPSPEMYNVGGVIQSKKQRYHIHARNPNLKEALNDALSQIRKMTENTNE